MQFLWARERNADEIWLEAGTLSRPICGYSFRASMVSQTQIRVALEPSAINQEGVEAEVS